MSSLPLGEQSIKVKNDLCSMAARDGLLDYLIGDTFFQIKKSDSPILVSYIHSAISGRASTQIFFFKIYVMLRLLKSVAVRLPAPLSAYRREQTVVHSSAFGNVAKLFHVFRANSAF